MGKRPSICRKSKIGYKNCYLQGKQCWQKASDRGWGSNQVPVLALQPTASRARSEIPLQHSSCSKHDGRPTLQHKTDALPMALQTHRFWRPLLPFIKSPSSRTWLLVRGWRDREMSVDRTGELSYKRFELGGTVWQNVISSFSWLSVSYIQEVIVVVVAKLEHSSTHANIVMGDPNI